MKKNMPNWKWRKWLKFCFRTRGMVSKEVFFHPYLGKWSIFHSNFLDANTPKVFGIMWRFFGSWIVVLIEHLVLEEMHLGTLKVWYEFTISTQMSYISIPSRCFYLSQVLCDMFYSKRWICTALPYFDGWFATAPQSGTREEEVLSKLKKKGSLLYWGWRCARSCLGQLRTGQEADNVMWNLYCQGITWQIILIVTPPSPWSVLTFAKCCIIYRLPVLVSTVLW